MQPPPSYPPGQPPVPPSAPPPRRSGFPAWGWALLGCGCLGMIAFVAIFAAILFPVFAKAREKARQTSCASNEKQMSLALMQYAQDNDERMPARPQWMDAATPYLMSRPDAGAPIPYRVPGPAGERALHCPSASGQDPAKYGYAFDSRLRSKSQEKITAPEATTLLYDSTSLGRNATDPGTSLPQPGRHSDGNNIAYLDGHVRWDRHEAGPQAGKGPTPCGGFCARMACRS